MGGVMAAWVGRSAEQIAAGVRAGDVSAHDVAAEHLDRIGRLNPELGAFVRVRAAPALSEAQQVDARPDRGQLPLAGVPVAIKDNLPVAGEPMRRGSAASAGDPQEADHPVVARLRAAGAVVVGLTNLPELAIYPFTDSVYGIARNPWDRRRTAGGSSGGAAAAVASAMVPIAQGNDGLGSIRIPAAVCGLFGIKPGTGVVPAQIGADSWGGLAENGPLTTTVADAALMLGVMAGATFSIAGQPGLRVAISTRPPGPGIRVHPVIAAAVQRCGEVIAGLGHTVRRADPPYPGWATPAGIERWFTASVPDGRPLLAEAGLEPRTRRHIRAGQVLLRVRPPRENDRERLRAALAPFFDSHDVLVMPTLARPAPAARRRGEGSWLRSVAVALTYAPMAGIWNLAGFPAAAVPMAPGETGLPGSVQLVAAPGGEALLLSLAAQLEGAMPWPRHAPGYAV